MGALIDSVFQHWEAMLCFPAKFLPLSPPNIVHFSRHQVDNMLTEMVDLAHALGDLTVARTDPDVPLPPASAQSFLKKTKLPGIFLADHRAEFTNR